MNSISAIAGLGIPLIPNVYGGEAPTEGFVLSAKDSDDVVRGTTQNDSSLVRRIVTTTAVCSLTVGAASASIIAMISIPAIMVFLAGVTCCLNSISVVYSHFHISRSPDLRSSVNTIRQQAMVLTETVDFLKSSADNLQNEIDDLVIDERNLEAIAAQEGYNCQELTELVRENESILDGMKQNLRETFVAEMTRLIIRSDKDNDMTINVKESRTLALRFKVQLQPHGVELDPDKFQRMIEEDPSIPNILKFCAEVLYPEVKLASETNEEASSSSEFEYASDGEEDPIFESLSRSHGSKPVTFAEYCEALSRLPTMEIDKAFGKMTTEDKLSMFTAHDTYSKGSVEVARGSRMSVLPRSQVRKTRYHRVSKITVEAQKRATISRRTVTMLEP